MREIKFRGLTSDNEWIYGDLIHDRPNETAYYKEFSQRISWDYSNQPVKNGTVGQFTGLTDVNDKEIYEGDIIAFDDNDGLSESWIALIKFIDYAWQCVDIFTSEDMFIEDMQNDDIVEGVIIGNIHDNPEMVV